MTPIYQVDAFAEHVFEGNPAAVVPLQRWPDDALLQSIAQENNLAETAFIVPGEKAWDIRWFTPTAEVALCGHATLAAAHVVFNHLGTSGSTVRFSTRAVGTLSVTRRDDGKLGMSFPAIALSRFDRQEAVSAALGSSPSSLWKGHYSEEQFDIVAVFEEREDVAALKPDNSRFADLGSRGIVATAPGVQHDFVSRYFAPAFGIPEDPVTGSAHCLLAPFWADRLRKSVLQACQISPRSGLLECHVHADRVELVGRSIDYLQGTLMLDL